MRIRFGFATTIMSSLPNLLLAQAAPPAPAPTELPHDSLDPAPHLPGLPWWVTPISILLLLGLAALIFKFMRRNRDAEPLADKSLPPLQKAREALLALKTQTHELTLPTFATRLSLTLRTYLADAKNDPSLFETREEFLAHTDRLKTLPAGARQKLDDLFAELNQFQYARPQQDSEQCDDLLSRSLQVLEGLSSTPSSELPTGTTLPPKPETT